MAERKHATSTNHDSGFYIFYICIDLYIRLFLHNSECTRWKVIVLLYKINTLGFEVTLKIMIPQSSDDTYCIYHCAFVSHAFCNRDAYYSSVTINHYINWTDWAAITISQRINSISYKSSPTVVLWKCSLLYLTLTSTWSVPKLHTTMDCILLVYFTDNASWKWSKCYLVCTTTNLPTSETCIMEMV